MGLGGKLEALPKPIVVRHAHECGTGMEQASLLVWKILIPRYLPLLFALHNRWGLLISS